MDAHRAALYNASDAGFAARFDNRAHGLDVDCSILRRRNSCLSIRGGHVIDHVGSADGRPERRAIGEIASDELDPDLTKRGCARGVPNERRDMVTAPGELAGQLRSRKPGRPGD